MSYPSYFLPIQPNVHQLGGLATHCELPGATINVDGCIQFEDQQSHVLEGYEHVSDGLHKPVIVECSSRIHGVNKGEVKLFCMSLQSSYKAKAVTASICAACPHRKGRE